MKGERNMRKLLIDQNVANTDLIIGLKIMQGNPTAESQNEFINQMIHARFLCVATFDPEPFQNENGEYEVTEGTKLLLNSVASQDKRAFIVAFTETKEALKYKKENEHTVITTYPDFCNMIFQKDAPYSGFVINPYSENIVVTKEIMDSINKNIRVVKKPGAPGMGQPGMGPMM